jgi:photosystem II stability/assembly factor-like uncharacterized protein
MDAQRANQYALSTDIAWTRLLSRALLTTVATLALSILGLAQNPVRSQSVASVFDATLHDCEILSIDRAYAVGDSGAILLTQDGGKQWTSLSKTRSEYNYYAIGMDLPPSGGSLRSGVIVGGTVQPASGRSVGIVLTTQDDGKTWNPSLIPGLPRLIGLQRIKQRHWIAWGDWSDHYGSALFESIDGGISWSPRPNPCGHLQSAAVSEDGSTLIVDRASRVFYATDGVDFRSVGIPSDQFHPIRFCKLQSQGWWMGGDGAQLWHSTDAMNWQRIELPISPADAPLVDCLAMAASGQNLWVVGKPSNSIWKSTDHGQTWHRQSTHATTVLLAIKALSDEVLLSCGRLGNIHQSRNGGNSWRESHVSAKRYLGLSLSATDQTIPWDAHGYIIHEGLHHSAAVVLHDRRFTESLHHQIDRTSALEVLANRVHLDHVSIYRGFPVSDLPNGSKINDLAYYQASSDQLLRMMVQEIRLHRPDVVLIEDVSSIHVLRSACGSLASQAIQLAGNPSYMPCESLGPDQPGPWTVQRTLQSSETSSGFSLSPSLVLKKTNQLLARPLQAIRYYYSSTTNWQSGQPPEALVGKAHYRMLNPKSASLSNPLDGLVVNPDTKLCDKQVLKTKLPTLMASANASNKVSELLQTRGSEVYRENAWDDALSDLIKPLSTESTLDVLWMVSQESRIQGNWHRWHSALQMIQSRYPNPQQQEMVFRELMTYMGSVEVDRMIRNQLQKRNQDQLVPESQLRAGSSVASPFSEQDSSVKTASFTSESRLTPIARGQAEQEFTKLLGSWPSDWRYKQSEPSWAWLIASRFRTSSYARAGQLNRSAEKEFWPAYFPRLGDWAGIHEQEQIVASPPEGSLPVPRIPWVPNRPHLDGIAESEFWSAAINLRLSTAWADETNTSSIRLCRDSEFLFIHMSLPRNRTSELAADTATVKKGNRSKDPKGKRDSLDPLLDHVRLRIDIDRDYATWFEFGWDIQGGLWDRCNDIPVWDPQWYLVLHSTEQNWNAEVAIPIAELIPDSAVPWEKLPWALSVQRERPSLSTEFLVAGDNDRWAHDQWLIINPAQP